jgi:signal transduction histidine kinase
MNERLEMVGSAAAGIAHDINNQLTLILNHLSTSDVDSAMAAVSRCCHLTAGLLSYCRGESLKLRPMDPAAFVRDFVNTLSIPAGIRLLVDAPAGIPEVLADPSALMRVLTNLTLNACDAMNGSGTLRIAASEHTIEVTDSGPGISALDRRRIFEPFFTTKGSRGTGLGLAIVREIMHQHGGAVLLRSTPGEGATFQLRFRVRH